MIKVFNSTIVEVAIREVVSTLLVLVVNFMVEVHIVVAVVRQVGNYSKRLGFKLILIHLNQGFLLILRHI
jgi:hypothetical protein